MMGKDKYNLTAKDFSIKEYANLSFYMQHRFEIAITWGSKLVRGDRVLELGCGDGYLAELFVRYGLLYVGVDIAQAMVNETLHRLRQHGLDGEVRVADVNDLALDEPYDAVVSFRTFFPYVKDPLNVLRKLRPFVRKKLIIDLNPRNELSIGEALFLLKEAGFRHVDWRPFLIPQSKKLPEWCLKVFTACEMVPIVRSFPLRWKFHCLLKGEP